MLSYTPPFIVIDIIFVSQYFVIRNDSCQLCVWNRRTGREQTNETLKPTSNLVRINNFQFATSHNKSQQVIVWNVKRLEQVKTIRTSPSFVDCYAPSTLLFSMNSDVVVMDLHTEKTIQLYKNVRNDIVGVQRINDRLIALTVHLPNENLYEVAMYNLDSKKYLPLFGTKKRCTRIGVWYGRLIFFIAEYTLFIMDVEKMVILATFKGKFQDQVKVCAF
jgi:WD40 repeat protein